MKKYIAVLLLGMVVVQTAEAQFTRYLVKLKNKGGSPYSLSNPIVYLSQRAIDRRTRYGIAIDSTDLPATPSYIIQIRNVPNVTVLNISKWLNMVSIQTSDPSAITTINGFSFVQSVTPLAARGVINHPRDKFALEKIFSDPPAERPVQTQDFFNYGGSSFNEIHLHNGEFLHNIGLRGQGVIIAMLDGGFFNYTTFKAFDSINLQGQVLGTWDFVAREASVVEDNAHGMMCLSTIAANITGQFVGKAPKASFYLFRTEDVATEYPIEEHNWVCGAERADSVGADVISSSLGYTDFDNAVFDHTYADMNGNTTLSAMGADLAAKKGLLEFLAAGNDGNGTWHFLGSPSDADSVICVGAVSSAGAVGSFSSYGPSSDGQVKPDMASVGVAALVQGTGNTVISSNGTSFACPNMAGMGTCLWQGFPEFNNMKIIDALRRSGSKFSTPDDRVGYGIPNVKTAFTNLLVDFATSNAAINACTVTINWTSKDIAAMKYEIERKATGEFLFSKIGEVNPQAGVILANHSYQFVNNLTSVPDGTVSYRIRQIVDTASASFAAAYIDTAIVTSSGCTTTGVGNPGIVTEKIVLIPNPASSQADLVIETNYPVSNMPIQVYDVKGSLIYNLQSSKTSGTVTIGLPLGLWNAGTYIIKVFDGIKEIGTTRLIKL
ncbi:MAG TPA: S8 family peptidase [Chitinophagaceae bacterium]|nr:S8 family peptidase [Chitinophagaceae bacterium]